MHRTLSILIVMCAHRMNKHVLLLLLLLLLLLSACAPVTVHLSRCLPEAGLSGELKTLREQTQAPASPPLLEQSCC
jgi:hypothetical protein